MKNRTLVNVELYIDTYSFNNVFLDQKIDGSDVEVTLAKPVDKEQRQQRAMSKAMMASSAYNYPTQDYVIPYSGPTYPYTVNQPLYPFQTPMSR